MDTPTISSLDDVLRSLKKLSTKVSELLKLNKTTREQLQVAASMFLEITDKSKTKNSPGIDVSKADMVQVKSLDKLRKNYSVLRELFDTKNELDAMEATLRTAKFGKASPERALAEVDKMRKEVLNGISEAFSFISGLAKTHLPAKLDLFSKGVCSSVEKSIIYQEGRVFTYVFEDEGAICFTVYLQLKQAEDEGGQLFPELFLTMTYKTGNSPQMYVGIQHHFSPPSADLLV